MKTSDAINWINNRGVRTGPYGLDRINYLLEELGNPHRDFACVLIGGTNGKGSVTAIAEAILANCQDYISGSFTSPHLIDLRERIKIQRKTISDQLLIQGVTQLQEICKIMDKEPSIGPASFFEVVTALAFSSFKEAEVDLAIIEVGLGGRFDSTNASHPEISVITNIGTDHQEYLGNGKISIAREKLGIVRKKRPLITGEKNQEILEEFTSACKLLNSPIIHANAAKFFEVLESRADGHLLKTIFADEPVFLTMPGEHQLENLAIALEVIDQLRIHGFSIPADAVIEGIKEVRWGGRLQWLPRNPAVLLDGAHNAEGLETLISYLEKFPPPGPLNIIFGALKDKPLVDMAARLQKFGNKLCFVAPTCGRAPGRDDFSQTLEKNGWQWFDTFAQAHEYCSKDAGTILVTGSLYLVSDALRWLK